MASAPRIELIICGQGQSVELARHDSFDATSFEENDLPWLCDVFVAVAMAALEILLITPGIQLRPAVASGPFMRNG